MFRIVVVICLMAFVVPSQVSAQVAGGDGVSSKEMVDVISLKDGRIIRGKILEKTDTFLIVRAGDGSISTFQVAQVVGTFQEEARMSTGPMGPGATMGTGQKGSGIGKIKIGGGVIFSPETGLSAHLGSAVPVSRLNEMNWFPLVEGTFGQYKYKQGFDFTLVNTSRDYYGTGSFSSTTTSRFIGVNALMAYQYLKWYAFGGAGFLHISRSIRISDSSSELSENEEKEIIDSLKRLYPKTHQSQSNIGITAGVGMNITKMLFAEVRWTGGSASRAMVTAGIKIP